MCASRGCAMSPAARSVRGRLADCAYLLDRAIKNPASTEDFARAAIDSLRLALRPSYAAMSCRIGPRNFHCGDSVLAADVDVLAEVLGGSSSRALDRPQTIRRADASAFAGLEHAMTASAFELVVPITDGGALLGIVAMGPRTDRRADTADEIEICDRIGARLALLSGREALAAEVAALRTSAASTDRLASVGRMAAGLAHEIRNPLVSIRTFTQLLPERHADE